jgi:hypothetical protein
VSRYTRVPRVLLALLVALHPAIAAAQVSLPSAPFSVVLNTLPIEIHATTHHTGTIVIENKRIVCTSTGQVGIYAGFPEAPAVIEPTIIVRNVTAVDCTQGLFFLNAWSAIVDGFTAYAAYDPSILQNGVVILGQSHDVKLHMVSVFHAINGVYIGEVAEGTIIDKSTFAGVVHGVVAHAQHAGRPWLVVSNSHIAASRAGVVAVNRKEVAIHNTLIYRHLRLHQKDWPFEGVNFYNVTSASLRDVTVNCRPNPNEAYPAGETRAIAESLSEIHTSNVQGKGC